MILLETSSKIGKLNFDWKINPQFSVHLPGWRFGVWCSSYHWFSWLQQKLQIDALGQWPIPIHEQGRVVGSTSSQSPSIMLTRFFSVRKPPSFQHKRWRISFEKGKYWKGNIIFWLSFCMFGQPIAILLSSIIFYCMHAIVSDPKRGVMPQYRWYAYQYSTQHGFEFELNWLM